MRRQVFVCLRDRPDLHHAGSRCRVLHEELRRKTVQCPRWMWGSLPLPNGQCLSRRRRVLRAQLHGQGLWRRRWLRQEVHGLRRGRDLHRDRTRCGLLRAHLRQQAVRREQRVWRQVPMRDQRVSLSQGRRMLQAQLHRRFLRRPRWVRRDLLRHLPSGLLLLSDRQDLQTQQLQSHLRLRRGLSKRNVRPPLLGYQRALRLLELLHAKSGMRPDDRAV